jgi:phosphoglycerate dehydrogenase-like enzyme
MDSGLLAVVAQNEAHAIAEAEDAIAILGHRYLRQSLPAARRLRWVQTTSNGVDHLPLHALAKKSVCLTRCTVASKALARHAYAMAWALLRNLTLVPSPGKKTADLPWLPFPKTALILGMGPLGKDLSILLKSVGIRVIGVKRSWDPESARSCDELITGLSFHEALSSADLCFCLLPLTKATKGMIDRFFLEKLPPKGVFINIGRSAVVDESALYEALVRGHLGGVGLDVAATDSPFRKHGPISALNFIHTPYIGAHYAERQDEIEAFVEAQVANFIAGKQLENVVNLRKAIEDAP